MASEYLWVVFQVFQPFCFACLDVHFRYGSACVCCRLMCLDVGDSHGPKELEDPRLLFSGF